MLGWLWQKLARGFSGKKSAPDCQTHPQPENSYKYQNNILTNMLEVYISSQLIKLGLKLTKLVVSIDQLVTSSDILETSRFF